MVKTSLGGMSGRLVIDIAALFTASRQGADHRQAGLDTQGAMSKSIFLLAACTLGPTGAFVVVSV